MPLGGETTDDPPHRRPTVATLAVFDFRHDHAAVLCAFDRLELDGEDLRRLPVEVRKAGLARLLHKPSGGTLNEHFAADGTIVFAQACKLGCEGIVSKRLSSSYRSGRACDWIKTKNPAAPAVTRPRAAEALSAARPEKERANGVRAHREHKLAEEENGRTDAGESCAAYLPRVPDVMSPPGLIEPCLPTSPRCHRPARSGFTRSSTMDSGSWRGARAPGGPREGRQRSRCRR
jgi:hypothetical protein